MKKNIALSLLTCALLCAPAPRAKAGMRLFNDNKMDLLLKRLEEKGVLSSEEVTELKKEDKKSRKEHSIQAGVRLQMRYEHTGRENDNDLNIRRMRLELKGSMYPKVDYKFEIAMDKMEDLSMKDASVTFKHLGPFAHIRVGQFKTPFSRQRITSSSKLQMIDRSPIEKLYPGRDTGIELSGGNDFCNYAVAAEAGVGDKRKFEDTDNSEWWYDGRIAFHPLGSVPLSEGEYSDKFIAEVAMNGLYAPKQVAFGERSVDDMFLADDVYRFDFDAAPATLEARRGDITIWGPELTVRYKGLSLAAEYYNARYKPSDDAAFRKIHSKGYFVQGGAFVLPKVLELTARYDRLDRNTAAKTQDDTREYTLGVNYFPFGDHAYKFQINYVNRREDRNDINNDSIVANMQIKY